MELGTLEGNGDGGVSEDPVEKGGGYHALVAIFLHNPVDGDDLAEFVGREVGGHTRVRGDEGFGDLDYDGDLEGFVVCRCLDHGARGEDDAFLGRIGDVGDGIDICDICGGRRVSGVFFVLF